MKKRSFYFNKRLNVELEAGHSTECITHAGHSIACLHFVTLTFDLLA